MTDPASSRTGLPHGSRHGPGRLRRAARAAHGRETESAARFPVCSANDPSTSRRSAGRSTRSTRAGRRRAKKGERALSRDLRRLTAAVGLRGTGGRETRFWCPASTLPSLDSARFRSISARRTSRSGLRIRQTRVASSGMGQPSTSTRRPRQAAGLAMAAAVVVVSSGCGMLGSTASAERLQLELISVSSPRVSDGDPLPADYSCKGSAGNPPLRWSRVPDDTTSVAVVTDSNGLTGGEVNWVVFDIDPAPTSWQRTASRWEPWRGAQRAARWATAPHATPGRIIVLPLCDQGQARS